MDIETLIRNFSETTNKVLVEGKSRIIYATEDEFLCFMKYKPFLKSVAAKKETAIPETDHWRALTTLDIMLNLEKEGIPTHIRYPFGINMNNNYYLMVRKVRPVPIEWTCVYQASGSMLKLFPALIKEGQKFESQIQKYNYKQELPIAGIHDTSINESQIIGLGLLNGQQLDEAKNLMHKVGESVLKRFSRCGLDLVDIKMEFGFGPYDKLLVIDELSQDCIRANDHTTGKPLTKDTFKQNNSDRDILKSCETFARYLNPYIESLIEIKN